MELVHTDRAPRPFGHYSQAVKANGMVFVSGILGVRPDDREIVVRDLTTQAEIVLGNLKAVLEAAGSAMEQVVKVTIYADSVANWDGVNEIYRRSFGDHRPARAFVPTGPLHHGFQIEIDAVAMVVPEAAGSRAAG